MLKNLILYKIKLGDGGIGGWEDALAKLPFTPTAPTQQLSVGWVPPRGYDGGELMVTVGRQRILRLMVEQRSVPADVVKRAVDAKAKQIEDATGRKPRKKSLRELKDETLHELLPRAFPKRKAVTVWLDLDHSLLAIDTTSYATADLVVQALLPTSLASIAGLVPAQDPQGVMSAWLAHGNPAHGFSIDRECELRGDETAGAAIRYQGLHLDEEDMQQRRDAGLVPTKLAMTYNSRVSFVLTENFTLRKIRLLDVALEAATPDEKADAFDADVAITTGEVGMLIDAFGGPKPEAAEEAEGA